MNIIGYCSRLRGALSFCFVSMHMGGDEHDDMGFGAAELAYMTSPKQMVVGGMSASTAHLFFFPVD